MLVALVSAIVSRCAAVGFISLLYYVLCLLIALALHSEGSINSIFPDTYLYVDIIEHRLSPEEYGTSSARAYAFWFDPLFTFFLNDRWVFLLFQIAMFSISASFIGRAVQNIVGSFGSGLAVNAYVIAAALMLSYPSAIIYSSANLREYITVLSAAILASSLTEASRSRFIAQFLVASALIYINRTLMIIPALVAALIFRQGRSFYAMLPVALIAALMAFYLVRGHAFSFDWLMSVRSSRLFLGDPYVYNVDSNTTAPWAAIELYMQFLLAPIPILTPVNWTSMKFFVVDLVYVSIAIAVAIWMTIRQPHTWAKYVLCFLVVSGMPALWEFYIGGAVRHRMPAIILLLPIMVLFVLRLIKSRHVTTSKIQHAN